MFGQGATTNTFGQSTAFGAATSAPFGTMNPQPQQGTLFGMSQPNSIFGASNTSQASSFGTQQPISTFGNTSLFGNANRGFGMTPGTTFSNTLGSSISSPTETTVKFSPQVGTDTMMKNGHSEGTSIDIRLPVYESKSLEELRFEDYQANKKDEGAQQNSSLFGSSTLNTDLNTVLNDSSMDEDAYAEIDSNQTKVNNELSLMVSAFFLEQDEEVDTVAKKCKSMSFTKSTNHQIIPSLFPCKMKSTIYGKRKLEFEALPSQNKANIYSVRYSTSPKVNFFNGSNRFCIVAGSRVLIFEADFFNSEKDDEQKLQEHLHLNSEFISSNSSRPLPLIKTNKFNLIVGADMHLNSLIEALYGKLSETLDFCKYQERIRRILNWLFTYNKTLPVPEKTFARIMHFLTTNELEFAVTESVNSKQPRLSYLLASGQYVKKILVMSQLDHWKRSESDAFIEHDLLKLYVLLSGQASWTLSTGQTVEVFEGLEWTQQLILLLLYKDLEVSDTEVFETNIVKSAVSLLTVKPNCVEYHLLAQNEPWMAISACSGLLDSWLLHESLCSFNVIADDLFNNKSDSIHLHLASQSKDLRWAMFFALHIRNDFTRYHFVVDLLVRNSTQLIDSEIENFLVDKLAVDKQLISDAKLLFKECPKATRL